MQDNSIVTVKEENNYIFCYTWQDAVRDGTFIDITNTAKSHGFTIPVAITSGLYHQHIEVKDSTHYTKANLTRILYNLLQAIRDAKTNDEADDNFIAFSVTFNDELVDIWATIEGKSPQDPSPVMTIYMPCER